MLLDEHFGLRVHIAQLDSRSQILDHNFRKGFDFLVDVLLVVSRVDQQGTRNVRVVASVQ